MRLIWKIFLIALLPLLAACEKELEYDVESPTPSLVVNSIFAQDSLWQVEVSTTASPGAGGQIQILKNADVRIYENNVRLVDIVLDSVDANPTFLSQTEGGRTGQVKFYFHRTSSSVGHAGRNYEIRVSHPGFPTVYSTSVIPRSPRTTIQPGNLTNASIIGGQSLSPIAFNILDEGGQGYYGIEVWTNSRQVGGEGMKRISFYSNDQILKANTVDNGESGSNYRFYSSASGVFFSNRSFIAQDQRFNLLIPATVANAADEVYVRVLRLSPELYSFVTSYQKQQINQANPFAEPAQVFSNIQNGSGIFAGYSIKSLRIK